MSKYILAASVLALSLSIVPANAASNLSFGAGGNFGNAQTITGTASTGTAAGGALATGTNTSIGAGIATTTPAGSLTSAVGASAGQSNAASGALSIGNGAAISGASSRNIGVGAGVGVVPGRALVECGAAASEPVVVVVAASVPDGWVADASDSRASGC